MATTHLHVYWTQDTFVLPYARIEARNRAEATAFALNRHNV